MIYSNLNCLLECSKSDVKVLQLYNPKDTWFRKITQNLQRSGYNSYLFILNSPFLPFTAFLWLQKLSNNTSSTAFSD